jgi:hypothetical protein
MPGTKGFKRDDLALPRQGQPAFEEYIEGRWGGRG